MDQEALVEALTNGTIRVCLFKATFSKLLILTFHFKAAGLDVTTPEPLPADHPLQHLPNCGAVSCLVFNLFLLNFLFPITAVILPHIGSSTLGARQEMGRVTAVNALLALQCKPLISEIPETRDLPFRPL